LACGPVYPLVRLSGQTTGASISVMNNICEGFDAGSTNEFIHND
jgi:four helix bundle protein